MQPAGDEGGAAARGPGPSGAASATKRWGTRAAAVAAGLAAATALVLFLVVGLPGSCATSHATLPDYALVSGTDPAGKLHLAGPRDAPFELLVRPSSDAGTRVVIYVFTIGEGEPNAIEAIVRIAPDGAVTILGRARMLEGASALRIVFGTANDTITRYEDALSHAKDGTSDAQVRVVTVPIARERD